jgi:hypothetical protein
MNFDEFIKSIDDGGPPPDLSETLDSLWWDKKGDWDTAHSIAKRFLLFRGVPCTPICIVKKGFCGMLTSGIPVLAG